MNLHPVRIYVYANVVQGWVSHGELKLIVYCCHLLTEPPQMCNEFLILFFLNENTKHRKYTSLFWIARSRFCSKHYRHKTKDIKKTDTHKVLSASDTTIHSQWIWAVLNNWWQIWFKFLKFSSFLTVCFLVLQTNNNKSSLWSWCRPAGWHFQPQHLSTNTEKHIVLTVCM